MEYNYNQTERTDSSRRQDRSNLQMYLIGVSALSICYTALCLGDEFLDGLKDQAANPFQGVDFHEVQDRSKKGKVMEKEAVDCHLKNSPDFKKTTASEYAGLTKETYKIAVADRAVRWTDAIFGAFETLKIPPTKENISIALILMHRESRMDTNPEMDVTNAFKRKKQDVLEQIDEKIPVELLREAIKDQVEAEFEYYEPRIEAAKTEIDINNELIKIENRVLYPLALAQRLSPFDGPDERIADLRESLRINTIGVLQVNPRIAQQFWETKGHKIDRDDAKTSLWRLEGNLTIGFAIFFTALEEYLSLGFQKKDAIKLAFADYNAGIYSSRNAALQKMIADLSGKTLITDGDMLIYEHDGVSNQISSTERAVASLFPNLDIRASLLTEKSKDFDKSPVYQAVIKAYRGKHGSIAQSELAIVPDAKDPDAMEKYGKNFDARSYTSQSMQQYNSFSWRVCR